MDQTSMAMFSTMSSVEVSQKDDGANTTGKIEENEEKIEGLNHVAFQIEAYSRPFLIVIGLIGNTLSLLVMLQVCRFQSQVIHIHYVKHNR